MNSNPGIKFPIRVDIATSAQKRSIIIQAELAGVDFPGDNAFKKHRTQYQLDKNIIFGNVYRLIRCIVDCQLHLQDGPATRHALELGRSLGAGVWESSPLQLLQIPKIGPVTLRKLLAAGINSIDALEMTEPTRINLLLSKNPGFGESIETTLKSFPKPKVSVRMVGKVRRTGQLWLAFSDFRRRRRVCTLPPSG